MDEQAPLFAGLPAEAEIAVQLPAPSIGEDVLGDYATSGTTLGPHPLSLLRAELQSRRCRSAAELLQIGNGRLVKIAGLVRGRQRPQTASGITFVTLEDEHGMVNVVVRHELAERQLRVLVSAQLMQVDGHLEEKSGVRHVIAGRLHDLTPLLEGLDVRSRDFR